MSGNTTARCSLAILVDDDGRPPCTPPDDCTVCRLFDHQRPAEARAGWLARIVGPPDGAYRWRYQHVN